MSDPGNLEKPEEFMAILENKINNFIYPNLQIAAKIKDTNN